MPAIKISDLNNAKVDTDHIADVATATAPTATDRFGNVKRTLKGAIDYIVGLGEAAVAPVIAAATAAINSMQALVASQGYMVPVPYTAGLDMTVAAQTVSYGGQTYAPIQSALPFTTSGAFEVAKFRLIQGVSGADLGDVNGAILVGKAAEFGTAAKVSDFLDNVGPAVVVYGAIRQNTADAGWQFINDVGHLSRKFNAPTTNVDGSLTIPYTFVGLKVGEVTVTPDETYASLGIKAGLSVGLSSVTLWAYKTLDFAINLGTLSVVPSTYFAGKVTAAVDGADSSVIVVTHPNCGSASVVPASAPLDTTQGFENRVLSYTATTIRVATFCRFSGYVNFNGTTWVVQTQCKNKPTFSFNGGSGILTVTHESISGSESFVVVTARDNATVDAKGGSSGSTSFEVIFRPLGGGATVTVPTTDMRFQYQSLAMVRREASLGVLGLKRDNCLLDLAKVASGSGNFWLGGRMWK